MDGDAGLGFHDRVPHCRLRTDALSEFCLCQRGALCDCEVGLQTEKMATAGLEVKEA